MSISCFCLDFDRRSRSFGSSAFYRKGQDCVDFTHLQFSGQSSKLVEHCGNLSDIFRFDCSYNWVSRHIGQAGCAESPCIWRLFFVARPQQADRARIFERRDAAFIQIGKPSVGLFVPWERLAWSASDLHVVDFIKSYHLSVERSVGLKNLWL